MSENRLDRLKKHRQEIDNAINAVIIVQGQYCREVDICRYDNLQKLLKPLEEMKTRVNENIGRCIE